MKSIIALLLGIALCFPTSTSASRAFVRASSQYLNGSTPSTGVPLTISLWFKTTNLTDNQVLAYLGDGAGNSVYYVIFRGSNVGDPVSAASSQSGVAFEQATSTNGVSSGAWTHVAAVFAANNDRRVFLNGTKTVNTGSAAVGSHATLNIGRYQDGTAYFDGSIAHVGIWSAALTDEEVASLQKGASPGKVRPQSLVEYWPLVGEFAPEPGIKGLTLTNTNTTRDQDGPRIYR